MVNYKFRPKIISQSYDTFQKRVRGRKYGGVKLSLVGINNTKHAGKKLRKKMHCEFFVFSSKKKKCGNNQDEFLFSFPCSDHECHVSFVRQFGLLAQPEGVVDGKGIDRHGQALGVDLCKLLATGIIPIERNKRNFKIMSASV